MFCAGWENSTISEPDVITGSGSGRLIVDYWLRRFAETSTLVAERRACRCRLRFFGMSSAILQQPAAGAASGIDALSLPRLLVKLDYLHGFGLYGITVFSFQTLHLQLGLRCVDIPERSCRVSGMPPHTLPHAFEHIESVVPR